MTDERPRRTLLYLPASNARAIEKARGLGADTIILDLEDAVAPDAKPAARARAVAAAAENWGGREITIRVNALGTAWCRDDFAAVAGSCADAIVVPKIDSPADAADAVRLAKGKPVWAMIETPRAVLAADAIAAVPGCAALVAGFADLAKDLRAKPGPGRLPLLYAASRIILSARAAGIPAFDGVYTAIRDQEGLADEARQGAELGFDGKTCVHPDQLEIVNRAFSPSDAEVEDARGLIAAHEAAMAGGKGVATWQGRMVELLHVAGARRILALASRLEGGRA